MAFAATELLLVDASGDFSIADDRAMTAGDAEGLWQIFAFGPALVMDGPVSYTHLDVYKRQAHQHVAPYAGADAPAVPLSRSPASVLVIALHDEPAPFVSLYL